MPETVTQAELRRRMLESMEEDLRISPKQAKDVVDSLSAAVCGALNEGDKVSLFGIVTLTPVFRLAKPKRKGTDRITGEEKTLDPVPAKVAIRATASKRVKDALPDPTSKAGKALKSAAQERRAAYEARQAAAEQETKPKAKAGRK